MLEASFGYHGGHTGTCGDIDRALGSEGRFSRAAWSNSRKEVWGHCSQRGQHVQRHRGACPTVSGWLGRSMVSNGYTEVRREQVN